ncbi:RluA family pseudouridine synthase [Alkalibacillus haloalkaliphilus]|uniref:RluA family pseudouridine synthase n=1 Tax=Alkalibacillus haloalkaliphilus TaxID=94136 RepID=UPI0029364EDD|nr:RluA family pseudouridine synthase [Alkalibacillus haloalkaliphilus]MDV2582873.1 RluA family pseudouridine synthase [Alkalibacillus haloalkaliphilus]
MNNFSIIFEDNHLLVVEKPVNMPVQEDESRDLDLLTALKNHIKERDEKPGNVYLALVHRLDRPVGGVMVYAKTSKAASRLSDQVRRHAMTKEYLAVIRGFPEKQQARLEDYLYKDKRKNQVYVTSKDHNEAKKAILDYTVLGHEKGLSLVRVNLHTGRQHQIRVQFANIGCPLYGDQKYGAKVNKPGQQIALWSHQLGLEHPTLKEEKLFTSTPPREKPWQSFNDHF